MEQKSKRSPVSLSRTIVVTAFLSVTLLVCVFGLELWFTLQVQEQFVAAQQHLLAKGAADTVKNFLEQQLNSLDQAADTNTLAESPERRDLVFNKLLGRNAAFRNILFLDKQGTVVEKASRFSDSGIPTGDWETSLLKAVLAGNTYISSVYIDPVTSEPLVVMAVPARDEFKEPQGALVAVTNLKFMWDLVSSIQAGANADVYVIDAEGYLIADKDTSLVLARKNVKNISLLQPILAVGRNTDKDELRGFSEGLSGAWSVSSRQFLRSPDWAVVVEMPVSSAYQTVFELLVVWLVLVLISIVSTRFLTQYIKRKVVTPIISLRDGVNKIGTAADALHTHVEVSSQDEVGELAHSFNEMTDRLNQTDHDLKVERARLLASINSLSFGFVIADTSDHILVKNAALSRILDLPEEPTSTTGIIESFKGVASGLDMLTHSCRECVELKRVVELKEVSHGKKYLRVFCTPVITPNMEKQDEVIGYVILIEDITEAKIMERSREEFFAVASHELRTPLTAIRGNADMILSMYADKIVDADMKEMLQDINSSSVRLIAVVNDFLDASRLEQGRIELKKETFAMPELVEKVTRDLKAMVEQKGLTLAYAAPATPLPTVFADKNRTEQILVNLIGNAIKFTKQGSITIALTPQDGFVATRVTDTGDGISEHNQALLFRKFQQAGEDMLARDVTQSTGLGLYISKLIISQMGGTIGLEKSELGKGSTFVFTLPVSG